MNVIRNINVPTGNILIVQGERGLLECLSLGDYGKAVNLIEKPVKHTGLMPLEEKWVITISTQYGCASGKCKFCDVPRVHFRGNASYSDLMEQISLALNLHPEVTNGKRLNVHFARMGEPTWNPHVLEYAVKLRFLTSGYLRQSFDVVHPVVSTMMPRHNIWLEPFIRQWIHIKNEVYEGDAGLQLSINSTDLDEREDMFGASAMTLPQIARLMQTMPDPIGRKYTLNFAVAGYEIDPSVLLQYFDPKRYIVKLTPMHVTWAALENGIKTEGDYTQPYPYEHHAKTLRDAGYDVLVFIASKEEDEGRITCGNAILSGSEPFGAGVLNADR